MALIRNLIHRYLENQSARRQDAEFRAWAEGVVRSVPYGFSSAGESERIRVEAYVDRLAFALQTREIK